METPQIHLHGCIIILGGLEQPNGTDPLAKMLNTVGQAVTQSYIRAAEPVHIQVESPQPVDLPRLQEAALAARPSSAGETSAANETRPAQHLPHLRHRDRGHLDRLPPSLPAGQKGPPPGRPCRRACT